MYNVSSCAILFFSESFISRYTYMYIFIYFYCIRVRCKKKTYTKNKRRKKCVHQMVRARAQTKQSKKSEFEWAEFAKKKINRFVTRPRCTHSCTAVLHKRKFIEKLAKKVFNKKIYKYILFTSWKSANFINVRVVSFSVWKLKYEYIRTCAV